MNGPGLLLGVAIAALAWRARAASGGAPAPPPAAAPTPAGAPPLRGEGSALKNRIDAGERDENVLTDVVFFGRHPERQYQPLAKHEVGLQAEWLAIRDGTVRPALAWSGGGGASGSF